MIELKRKVVEELEDLKSELEGEKESILKACARFGVFLKKYSVMTYNDALVGYLNLLLKQEREKAELTQDFSRVHSLEQLKLAYMHVSIAQAPKIPA